MSTLIDKEKFEEKHIEADFEFVFKQVSNMEWHGLREPMEFVYRKAYIAGKAAGIRESLGSPDRKEEA